MKHAWLYALAVMAGLSHHPAAAQTVPAYTFVDLGTLRGKFTLATGINASGQISGYGYFEAASSTSGPYSINNRAFRITPNGGNWFLPDSNGYNTLMQVFTLDSTHQYSEGHAINAGGGVAGQMLGDGYTTPQNAFYGSPAGAGSPVSSSHSWSWAINDLGSIAGSIFPNKGGEQPTLWRLVNGSFTATNLNIPNGHAKGVNNLDQVCGSDGNIGVPYLWLPSSAYGLPAGKNLLGTFGGTTGEASAINNAGQIVGSAADSASVGHGFFWTPATDTSGFGTPGQLLDLGTDCSPVTVNNPLNGQPLLIAGAFAGNQRENRAFVWDSTLRQVRDLNTLVVNPPARGMFEARGVNASGQIVGNYNYYDPTTNTSYNRPCLLLPNSTLPDTAAAPAPVTGLNAAAPDSNTINLAWMDNASDENGVKIDRSTDGASFTQVGSAAADAKTFSDPTVIQAMAYTYRVSAFNVKGYAPFSEVTVSTPGSPLTLTNRVPGVISASSLKARWGNNSNVQTGVVVEWSKSSSFATTLGSATVGGAATEYTFTGLTKNTTYYVRVKAQRTGYPDSLYSAITSATTATR